MTIEQLQAEHFHGKVCVEEKDKVQALNLLHSKTSACWGNGPVKGTEWTVLAQPSKRMSDSIHLVIVCKTELIEP